VVVRIIEIIMDIVVKPIIQEGGISTQIVFIMIETITIVEAIMTTTTATVVIVIIQNLVNMLSLITTGRHGGRTTLIRTTCHQSLVNIRRHMRLIDLIDRVTQYLFQRREVTAEVSLPIGNVKNNQSL
jgi:hypothetical protein